MSSASQQPDAKKFKERLGGEWFDPKKRRSSVHAMKEVIVC
jgi:hypothetical protein